MRVSHAIMGGGLDFSVAVYYVRSALLCWSSNAGFFWGMWLSLAQVPIPLWNNEMITRSIRTESILNQAKKTARDPHEVLSWECARHWGTGLLKK